MRAGLALKTMAFLVVVPGVVAGLIPWMFVLALDTRLSLGPLRLVGMALVGATAAVYLWCSIDLARYGDGIPAPVDPTRFLVRKGMYQRVRNPMYASAILFFVGLALATERLALFIYAVLFALCYHVAVVRLEEPALRKRFGTSYEEYCAQVPRWIPRLKQP